MQNPRTVLVHLASGIGNIVLATPLLVALDELGFVVDLVLDPDYPQTADLFRGWSVVRNVFVRTACSFRPSYAWVIPAIPPFYWSRFSGDYRNAAHVAARPSDGLFFANEQDYYLSFAWALGYPRNRRPFYRLPIAPSVNLGVTPETVVMAPGCKTGVMAAKRWPGFPQLAERFRHVVVVGTAEDETSFRDGLWKFPSHVRSFMGKLSLRETAELMSSAGVVVANDSGLAHVAGAVGAPTLILFGPTPDRTLGAFPPNVQVLRRDLACAPCWFENRLVACRSGVDCLTSLDVDTVERAVSRTLGPHVREVAAPPALTQITLRSRECAERPIAPAVSAATNSPSVSCIMPTSGRREFVRQAVRYFQRQDYPNRELLILDDGPEWVDEILPPDPQIRCVRLEGFRTLGAKRNLACEMAAGEIIVHWDDDDWSAPQRLTSQVRMMIEHPSRAICGLSSLYFLDPFRQRAWLYQHPAGGRAWVAGGTMCYRKELWRRKRFPDVTEGEDTRFVWSNPTSSVLATNDPSLYVATVHERNTSAKHTSDSRWRTCSIPSIRSLLDRDWPFYSDWGPRGPRQEQEC
jgi:ADP-heptose:LPS heptosyltransferase